MQMTSTTEQRGFFVFEGLWGYPETKCTPKLVILLRQDWSVCRTRTVSWNVLEQTVYYIRVHTYTNTHCNFSRFKNKMPIRKGWAGTVKDVRKKNKEKKKGCREETFTSKLKKNNMDHLFPRCLLAAPACSSQFPIIQHEPCPHKFYWILTVTATLDHTMGF